jgi:O-antigen ligase
MLLTAVFTLCLWPVSVGEYSVNYAFMLVPVAYALVQRRIARPPAWIVAALAYYGVILALALLLDPEPQVLGLRRLVSFGLFVSSFAFVFVPVTPLFQRSFKAALVAVSLLLSLLGIVTLARAGWTEVGFDAKDLVGSQRVGFIYIPAIWLVYLSQPAHPPGRVLKWVAVFILGVGLLITFSRSSIVAFAVTVLLRIVSTQARWWRAPSLRGVVRAVGSLVALAALVAVLYSVFPVVFEFFNVRLVGFLSDPAAVEANLGEPETSEGTRVFIATHILQYVAAHPLTATGYLGIWTLADANSGSAHNQYLDVLLRTGIGGLLVYLGLLAGIFRNLQRHERALWYGFAGVLAYGFFHETFKESQGACLLAFLIGLLAETMRAREALAPTAAGTAAPAARPAPGRS